MEWPGSPCPLITSKRKAQPGSFFVLAVPLVNLQLPEDHAEAICTEPEKRLRPPSEMSNPLWHMWNLSSMMVPWNCVSQRLVFVPHGTQDGFRWHVNEHFCLSSSMFILMRSMKKTYLAWSDLWFSEYYCLGWSFRGSSYHRSLLTQTVFVTGVIVWLFVDMARAMRAVWGQMSFGDCHSVVMMIHGTFPWATCCILFTPGARWVGRDSWWPELLYMAEGFRKLAEPSMRHWFIVYFLRSMINLFFRHSNLFL